MAVTAISSTHETEGRDDPSRAADGLARLRALIQGRRLTKAFLATEDFKRIWDEVQQCLDGDRGTDLWEALSVVGRAAAISRPARDKFHPAIRERLKGELPAWKMPEDGEDRYYLAKALQTTPDSRIVDLAFSELAREEAAEKARRVWAEIAFEHSSTREEFLTRLNGCIADVKRAQRLTTDSLIRRIRRISNAISHDLAIAEKPTGAEFGEALRKFYAGTAIAKGPEDRELREESANEFMESVAAIVRLNFWVASDPKVYDVPIRLRRWWRPAAPPATFEAVATRMAQASMEALHIFARQGVRNKPLRTAMVSGCGRRIVNQLAKAVASADVSLPEDISYWLAQGREQPAQKRTIAAIEQLSERGLDELVGQLLIEISSPDANVQAIASGARAIARFRDMELLGSRGEIVAYDPAAHEATENCAVGSKVIVAAPGVARKVEGRPQVLIVKIEVRKP